MAGNLLVTGGTGTVGSLLVNYLEQSGNDFRVLVRDAQKGQALADRGIKTIPGDFADTASLDRAMEGVHRAFLLTPPHPEMVVWQTNAILAARRTGVKHVVKLSITPFDPDASINLVKWHSATEVLLRESGVAYTIIRPHSFMQNWIASAGMIKGGTFYGSMGDMPVPFVDARDVAEVAYRAMTGGGHKGKIYRVTGPQAISQRQVAEAFGKALNRSINYVNIPHEAALQGMLGAGLPEWLARDLDALQRQWADGIDVDVSTDSQMILRRPGKTVEDFTVDYVDRFE
ncbi:MAG: SDR family oxidoreductase [Saprospiraceae bacterium]|nr:SDR family oxidoreductase [Saprospiraceae bacterium]